MESGIGGVFPIEAPDTTVHVLARRRGEVVADAEVWLRAGYLTQVELEPLSGDE